MKTFVLVNLVCVITALASNDVLRASSDAAEIARLNAESMVPPFTRWVLMDAGFSIEEALAYEEKGNRVVMVDGPETIRADIAYQETQKRLKRLPSSFSNGFVRVIVQWAGIHAAWRDDVAERLDLTDDQRRSIEGIFMRPRTNAIDSARLETEVLGVFNPEQLAGWSSFTNPACRSIALSRMMETDELSGERATEMLRLANEIEKDRTMGCTGTFVPRRQTEAERAPGRGPNAGEP